MTAAGTIQTPGGQHPDPAIRLIKFWGQTLNKTFENKISHQPNLNLIPKLINRKFILTHTWNENICLKYLIIIIIIIIKKNNY